MPHFLYILHSFSLDRYYIGETSNIENRMKQHLNHYFSKNYTKSSNDWAIVFSQDYTSRKNALFLEQFIKRMKSKKFIQKIIADPKILDEILSKKQNPGSPEASGLEAPH